MQNETRKQPAMTTEAVRDGRPLRPVMTYVYRELVKLSINFEPTVLPNGRETVRPVLKLGAGSGVGDNAKMILDKPGDEALITYQTVTGEQTTLHAKNDGKWYYNGAEINTGQNRVEIIGKTPEADDVTKWNTGAAVMQYDPDSMYLVSADRTKCLVDITHMFVMKQIEPPEPLRIQGPELYEGDTGFNFWDGYLSVQLDESTCDMIEWEYDPAGTVVSLHEDEPVTGGRQLWRAVGEGPYEVKARINSGINAKSGVSALGVLTSQSIYPIIIRGRSGVLSVGNEHHRMPVTINPSDSFLTGKAFILSVDLPNNLPNNYTVTFDFGDGTRVTNNSGVHRIGVFDDTASFTKTYGYIHPGNYRIWVSVRDTNGVIIEQINGNPPLINGVQIFQLSGFINVTVESETIIPVRSVTLSQTNSFLTVGNHLSLTATVLPINATNKTVTWVSNKNTIATVSQTGIVTARERGRAVITAIADRVHARCNLEVDSLIISNRRVYQSPRLPGKDEHGNTAPDMVHLGKDRAALNNINIVIGAHAFIYDQPMYSSSAFVPPAPGPEYVKLLARGLADTFTVTDNSMRMVARNMFDRFFIGDNSDFRNTVLTDKVYAHASTQHFAQLAINAVTDYIKRNSGNPAGILSNAAFNAILDYNNDLIRPRFNTAADRLNGLSICVNDTWGCFIDLQNYVFDGIRFSGSLRFTIYDHFGLDYSDVAEDEYDLNWFIARWPGFAAWFVLQHYENTEERFKPFISYFERVFSFNGTI
jgi:hypothetical protein